MSFLIAAPEFVSAAASDLAKIGSTIGAANAAAEFPTTSVLAAGADEVSVSIAALFGAHAQAYQALSAKAAAFHSQFVQRGRPPPAPKPPSRRLNAVNAPTEALVGRPLIGNGANGAPGQNGGDGGILIGNGGQAGLIGQRRRRRELCVQRDARHRRYRRAVVRQEREERGVDLARASGCGKTC